MILFALARLIWCGAVGPLTKFTSIATFVAAILPAAAFGMADYCEQQSDSIRLAEFLPSYWAGPAFRALRMDWLRAPLEEGIL